MNAKPPVSEHDTWMRKKPLILDIMKNYGGIWIDPDYFVKNFRQIEICHQKTWGDNASFKFYKLSSFSPFNAYSYDDYGPKNICDGDKSWIVVGKKYTGEDIKAEYNNIINRQNIACG